MRYKILSGTDIRECSERYDSAPQALEAVTSLLARQLPNIRVFDENGHELSVSELRALAVEEKESDDA